MSALQDRTDLAGELLRNEPMARHTSWRVGGPADLFYRPASVADLGVFLRWLDPQMRVYWLGLGSNLLVRDGGLRGAVILTHGVLSGLERLDERTVRAESGVPCAKLARHCARWGIGPAEFFAGIPGTLGGALAMNAGAFGGETWDQVIAVEVIDRQGQLRRRGRAEYDVSYRTVVLPAEEWFVAAHLMFEASGANGAAAIRELLQRRKRTQPVGQPSCGSVFRNPPGDHAARLIEAAGLKGLREGGAVVSPMHANFIINEGQASAADIETLIATVARRVREKHGVRLVPEVRIVGEHG